MGKKIRGFNNLQAYKESVPHVVLLNDRGVDIPFIGSLLYIGENEGFAPGWYLFNKRFTNTHIDLREAKDGNLANTIRDLLSQFGGAFYFPNEVCPKPDKYLRCARLSDMVYSMEVLDDDFFQKFHDFMKENSSYLKPILHRYSVTDDFGFLQVVYAIVGDSKNFFAWALKMLCQESISFVAISWVMYFNERYKGLSKLLSKNTITAYTRKDTFWQMVDELLLLRRNKRVSDTINEFNTFQKKLLKNVHLDEIGVLTLSRFQKLSPVKRQNFIRKMSTIQNGQTIVENMEQLMHVHFRWDKEDFLKFINNGAKNVKVMWQSEHAILIRVYDFETIKNIAKTTNWCISKNKTYWDDYVEYRKGAAQYVILDFSKPEDDNYSIVGFTVSTSRITNAHDFTNNNILPENAENIAYLPSTLFSYLRHSRAKTNIYDILKSYGIPMEILYDSDVFTFQWNKESCLTKIKELCPKMRYNIAAAQDGKMVIELIGRGIDKLFVEDAFRPPYDFFSQHYFLFLDFAKPATDTGRFYVASIRRNVKTMIDECVVLYNAALENQPSFILNILFREYGAPLNIISRSAHKDDVFMTAFRSFDAPFVSQQLADPHFIEVLRNDANQEVLNIIYASLHEYLSPDYLNVFYNKNYTLTQVLGNKGVKTLFQLCVSVPADFEGGMTQDSIDDLISDLINGELLAGCDLHSAAHCVFVKSMILNEPIEVVKELLQSAPSYTVRRRQRNGKKNVLEWMAQIFLKRAIQENYALNIDKDFGWVKSIAKGNEAIQQLIEQLPQVESSVSSQSFFNFN